MVDLLVYYLLVTVVGGVEFFDVGRHHNYCNRIEYLVALWATNIGLELHQTSL